MTAIPEDIREIIGTPQGAASAILALLIDADSSGQDFQSSLGRSIVLQGKIEPVLELSRRLSELPGRLKLPLMELAMPPLASMTGMEKRNFLLIVQTIVNADGRVSLMELSVQWILEKYLNPSEDMFRTITKFSLNQVARDILVLVGALASAGNPGNREKARAAFDAGIARIPELAARKPDFDFEENASYAVVSRVLTDLTSASFKIKEIAIDACAHCALADQTLTDDEGELLRVVALALQCPLPPFVQPSIPAAAMANRNP